MVGSAGGSVRSLQSGRSGSQYGTSAGRTPVPPPAESVRSGVSGRRSTAASSRSARTVSERSMGSRRTAGGMSLGTDRSITSTEALGKLSQLEALLDKEREARRAAETTLRALVNSRHPKGGQDSDAATQRQLDLVMNTLKGIITDADYKPAHGRRAPAAGKTPSSHGRMSNRSATSTQRHRQTAARSGFTTDHRGGLHFTALPEGEEEGDAMFPHIVSSR